MVTPDQWKLCSNCKKPIPFGSAYYQCSVSTCQRSRTALYFCSVPCWDAHLPMMRHREAWAEPMTAPTRMDWERQQAEEAESVPTKVEERTVNDETEKSNDTGGSAGESPREVLVVVSKLKAYIKANSGMNTSDGIVPVLSDYLRRLCDQAIENAKADGRKTVLDRDVRPLS
jgi:hypothetical protein